MDAYTIVAMNEQMGRLIQAASAGCLEEVLDLVFCSAKDTQLNIEEMGIFTEGIENLRKVGKQIQYDEGIKDSCHLLHSNTYDAPENGQEAGAQWNSHSMWLTQDKKGVRFGYLRFLANFRKEGAMWKIWKLDIRALIVFPQWPNVSQVFDCSRSKAWLKEAFLEYAFVCPKDFMEIRNLLGRFVQEGPVRMLRCFSEKNFEVYDIFGYTPGSVTNYSGFKEFIEEVRKKELEQKAYVMNMAISSFIFKPEPSGHQGKAFFLAQTVAMKQKEGNFYEVSYGLGRGRAYMIKEEGDWKFSSIIIDPLAVLKDMEMEVQTERPMAMRREENWCVGPKKTSMSDEAAAELFTAESILPHWTERLKRGDNRKFIDLYMKNSKEEISMGMSGPRRYGYKAVLQTTSDSTAIFPKGELAVRFPQFHTGISPVAQLSEDGNYAELSWMDYGWGNAGYGVFYAESQKHRMYRPMIGQYYHKFVKDKGTWKMYSFGWTPMIQCLPSWEYCTDDVQGWAAKPFEKPWPLPLETDE